MPRKPLIITRIDRSNVDLSRAFGRFVSPWQQFLPISDGKWQPNADVLETDDHFIVRLELAGVPKEQVHILYQEGRLVIYGQRQDPLAKSPTRYLQLEINYHEFERVIIMPDDVQEDRIEAKMEDGILRVVIPKVKESMVGKQIKVNVK
jgi:HSP20 family protein